MLSTHNGIEFIAMMCVRKQYLFQQLPSEYNERERERKRSTENAFNSSTTRYHMA